MNIYNIIQRTTYVVLSLALLFGISSCNDFLEKAPLDQVTPEQFFATDKDLGTYAINYYSFSTHGNWGLGTLTNDNGTDNQVSNSANEKFYVKDNWKVLEYSGSWNFSRIRAFNYFFENALPKVEAGIVTGSQADIEQYVGEIYFLRAYEYFEKVKAFGDFPIITKTLKDVHEEVMEASKRRPRNEVVRFILDDLDKSLTFLKDNVKAKNRITRDAALLFKSRVALYEASFLKYHSGTPRVPGEAGWPGAKMDYNAGFTIDISKEIDFFLDVAMKSSKELADKISLTPNSGVIGPKPANGFAGWNPYFEMFGEVDMSKYDEVIFWRAYVGEFLNHAVGTYMRSGGDMGVTKGLIDGFLMKDGLPIYASGVNYHGDVTIDDVKKDRDDRLQLFVFGEKDLLTFDKVDQPYFVPRILEQAASRDVTGYRVRKCYSYDPAQAQTSGMVSNYGSIVFRAVEAHLNYIEASYLKTGSIDATATDYWQKIRTRAGVDPNFNKTITNTDLSKENDWGKYSGATLVDATLFNIRRERRNELMGESLRMHDLRRWRALDEVKDYIIEGFNLWDKAFDYPEYSTKDPETGVEKSLLISDGTSSANVSSKDLSKYLRPFQKVKANNSVYNGLNWNKANYLEPIGFRDLQLASPSKTDASASTIYQNPYWPTSAGSALE